MLEIPVELDFLITERDVVNTGIYIKKGLNINKIGGQQILFYLPVGNNIVLVSSDTDQCDFYIDNISKFNKSVW